MQATSQDCKNVNKETDLLTEALITLFLAFLFTSQVFKDKGCSSQDIRKILKQVFGRFKQCSEHLHSVNSR